MKKNILKLIFAATFVALLSLSLFCIGISAEESDNELDIAYSNLSFENEIHLLYAIESNDANVKLLVWTKPQENYTYGTQSATLSPTKRNYDINGVAHTVFEYDGLSAKQMADNVYVRAYINDGNTETYGEVDKYSILMYAYSKLGKTGVASTNENLKSMLSSMLEYGANAQKYFGYKTDRLANDNWVQIKTQGGTLEDGFNHGMYLPGDEITLTASETTNGIFIHWETADETEIVTNPTFNLTVGSSNETYTAKYKIYSQGLAFTSNGDGTCTLTGLGTFDQENSRGLISIPPVSPAGDTVTAIGSTAFGYYELYTYCYTLEIPSTITSIDMSSFYRQISSGIWSVSVDPENTAYRSVNGSLIEISTGTLLWGAHDGMGVAVIPNDGSIKAIADGAFSDCNLESIVIPSSVTKIGRAAFAFNDSLTSITFEDTTTWYATDSWNYTGGSAVSVTDPQQNTAYFNDYNNTYYYCYWYKK